MVNNDKWVRRWSERATPFLEPNEQIRHVFAAQDGMNANLMIFLAPFGAIPAVIAVLIWLRGRLVVVTDRAVVVLDTGLGNKPKRLFARLGLNGTIDAVGGGVLPFREVRVGERRMWVPRRFWQLAVDAAADLQAVRG